MSQPPVKPEEEEPKQDMVQQALATVKPVVGNVTFGTVMGYCSATAMKKIGQVLAILVGITFVSLQVAVHSGYIQVDWNKIQIGFKEKIDATGDGKINMDDAKVYWKKVKEVLTHRLPAAGGFSFGFLYGLRS
jgi:uncharacterized membrane protein (Fun14 family)